MKKIDKIGNAALLLVIILIFYLTPNFGNYLSLLQFTHEESQARNAIQEQEKQRVSVMLNSVESLAIKDPNLKACVVTEASFRARINPGSTGGRAVVSELDILRCPGMQVRTLDGIEGMSSLRTLVLDRNDIRELQPLSGLAKLESLDLMDNQVVDVSPLTALPKLKSLNLRGNVLIDITQLTALKGLQRLVMPDLYNAYCADVEYIQTFEHIRKSTAIGRLYCQGRMTRELARILAKDRAAWTRKEEMQVLVHRINERKKWLQTDTAE